MADVYCVRCKEKTPQVDGKEITTKNNRSALKGKCEKCGTTTMQFIKSSKSST